MTDENRNTWLIATAQNIATNGRMFCVLLFAFNAIVYLGGQQPWPPSLMLLSALPVGLSCIVDAAPSSVRRSGSVAVYAFTALVFILSLANIG